MTAEDSAHGALHEAWSALNPLVAARESRGGEKPAPPAPVFVDRDEDDDDDDEEAGTAWGAAGADEDEDEEDDNDGACVRCIWSDVIASSPRSSPLQRQLLNRIL